MPDSHDQPYSSPEHSDSPFPLEPPEWSREAQLASSVWFGLDTANRFVILDRWGEEEVCKLEYKFLRKHQETHFLDGLKKLGLENEPPHIASAKYHVLSNVLGGLDLGYQYDEAEDRGWIFYFPPSAFGAAPVQPGPGICGVPSSVCLAGMKGWHANNGVLLNSPNLRFTVTSLMTEGDPYDAGFFDLSERDLTEDERFRNWLGQGVQCIPGKIPQLGPSSWPQERKDKALQKFSAQYAIGGVAQIADFAGEQEAAAVIETALSSLANSWARLLVREYEIRADSSPERLRDLFAVYQGLAGDEVVTYETGGAHFARVVRTRLSVPEYIGWEIPPQFILEAMARAWTRVSPSVGNPVNVGVQRKDRVDGVDYSDWSFELA